MKNYIQDGEKLTLVAPSGGVTSGTGYVIGAIFAVAEGDAVATANFVGATEGVFSLPKATGGTGSQGGKVWFNNSTKACLFASATGLFEIGVLTEAATSGPLTCKVKLNQIAVTAVA